MKIDKVFEALASDPRRQILAYLSEAELTTSDLAERFSMSAPTISRHLSVLENAGLVTSERKGQYVWYRLNRDHLVNTLSSYAFELCPIARPLKRESKKRAKNEPAR
jgi:ArsR family transcriptional regulator, arsenate/arsenite/antimonite-responsive transcriptional repressor